MSVTGAGVGATLISGTASGDTHETSDAPPRLHVEGNQLVTSDGEAVTLRGVNTIDPKRANVTAPARGKDAIEALDLLTDSDRG